MKLPTPGSIATFRRSALAAVVALASQLVLAQDAGFYAGAGLAKDWVDIDADTVLARFKATGASSAMISTYDNDVAAKVFAGYRINRNFAVEAGYADLGKFNYDATLVPKAVQQGTATLKGFSVDLIGSWPVQDNLAFFARLGVNNVGIEQSFSNPLMGAGFTNGTARGTHVNLGAGLEYTVTDAVTLRAELQRYKLATNNVLTDNLTALSLSAVYHFGTGKPPAAPEVAKPAARPAPPPVVATAPAPVPLVKVTLAASTLFDFDRWELKAVGKKELDKLVQELKGVRYEVIIVTGHSDRLGKHEYNLALSERRASAVKTYLVSAGIAAASITAKGVNSDKPVTTLQQCQGPRSTALKACLQPDRRVEVEVSGTRDPK